MCFTLHHLELRNFNCSKFRERDLFATFSSGSFESTGYRNCRPYIDKKQIQVHQLTKNVALGGKYDLKKD